MPKFNVFISYSHEDKVWKDQLIKHLEALGSEKGLVAWSDERIKVGENWQCEIETAMEEAHVAVLLVSVDFLNSIFIRDKEVPFLLERRAKDGMQVYPLIVRPCTWPQAGWLGSIQARLFTGKPLSALRGHNLESALANVAEEIWRTAEKCDIPQVTSEFFLTTYRECLRSKWSRWDLAPVGVTQAGGARSPIEATLDHMYLPLRFAAGFDVNVLWRGRTLLPDDVIHQRHPLVIRGSAGSGKTTWMRWTFRRLLHREDALPVMLVLRDLARRWQDPGCTGFKRSLDAFLDDCVSELLGKRFQGELQRALFNNSGPQPILLVDGWDETGRLGEELREKLLIFMKQYPHLRVVVTSRPYGHSWPSHGEGFVLLDIQPLSDTEVRIFSEKFFSICYGEDLDASKKEALRFHRALERSIEPQALARTALLLTMMLLISRSRPLPDKRHLLYEACIENLLTALPQRKEEEGAVLDQEQYRPLDSEMRLRVVAELAFRLQDDGYKEKSRSPIVRRWKEMARLLPESWQESQRLGFLAWLAGPAGLLADRADDTLSFTHLSFQEFLTAWYLNAEVEGAEARVAAVRERVSNWAWWETVRLWAALIERQNPEKLNPVFDELKKQGEEGLCLAGTLLADGLGSENSFKNWVESLLGMLSTGWSCKLDTCSLAWAASRQDLRKEMLTRDLGSWASMQRWLGWIRGKEFAEAALGFELPLPINLLSRGIVSDLDGPTVKGVSSVAGGRILAGGSPIWPMEPWPLGLLQVWPGQRRLIGQRLQLAASCGAQRREIVSMAAYLLKARAFGQEEKERASLFALYFARDSAHGFARYFARDFAKEIGRYLVGYFSQESALDFSRYYARYFCRFLEHFENGLDPSSARALARAFPQDFPRYFFSDFDIDLARHLTGERARIFVRDLACDFVSTWNIEKNAPWLESFASVELSSLGRFSARSILSRAKIREDGEAMLLSEACQLSLHPDRDPYLFLRAIEKFSVEVDPLWPALARHIARRTTDEDRILLGDLARSPDLREAPLSWGLRFIVRGDIMFEDGSIATLDELADETEVPHLPYIEEIPDELEIKWERD